MTGEASTVLGLLAGKAAARILSGVYRGLDGTRGLVDFEGGRVPAYIITGDTPSVNEPVWVMVLDDVAYIVGPTTPRPGNGVIVSAAGGVAEVDTALGRVTATCDGSASFPVGAGVKLMWLEGAHVVGIRGAVETPTVPPIEGGGRTSRLVTFSPNDSGSYQAGYGWRTNDVWSSSSNSGGWFYGTTIADTIPDDAAIDAADIYLPPPDRLLGARPFGRHSATSKPGGALTFDATTTLPGTSGWQPVPLEYIDHLKVHGGGLGFSFGGWNVWPGTQRSMQTEAPSGALRVRYTA